MNAYALEGKYLEGAISLYRMGAQWMPSTVFTVLPEQAHDALVSLDSQWWVFIEEGEMIALAGYERIKPIDRVAEPYVVVVPKHRKTGIGVKISEFLFERRIDLNLQRIQSIVLSDAPSLKLLEHLGFEHEGTLQRLRLRDGELINGELYAWIKE